MEEGSVILPVASMVTDFLKLCQLGDLKGINALVYPVEPVSPRSDDEDADPEPDAEKEPAIDVNIVNEKYERAELSCSSRSCRGCQTSA